MIVTNVWRCLRWTPRLRRWPEIAGTIFSSMVSRFKRVHRRHHCCHHNHLARHSHIHLFWSNSIMIGECMESLANIMADIVRTRLGVRRWSRTGCGKENERRRKNLKIGLEMWCSIAGRWCWSTFSGWLQPNQRWQVKWFGRSRGGLIVQIFHKSSSSYHHHDHYDEVGGWPPLVVAFQHYYDKEAILNRFKIVQIIDINDRELPKNMSWWCCDDHWWSGQTCWKERASWSLKTWAGGFIIIIIVIVREDLTDQIGLIQFSAMGGCGWLGAKHFVVSSVTLVKIIIIQLNYDDDLQNSEGAVGGAPQVYEPGRLIIIIMIHEILIMFCCWTYKMTNDDLDMMLQVKAKYPTSQCFLKQDKLYVDNRCTFVYF